MSMPESRYDTGRARLLVSDLSPQQRYKLCNGCGSKGGPVPVPDFIWKDACDQHDLDYWVGGNELDRLAADRALLQSILLSSFTAETAWARTRRKVAAHAYYWAVRAFGARSFHYGKPRGWWEVVKECRPKGGKRA